MWTLLSAFIGSGALVSIIGYAFNLGNRITKVETQHEGLHELINAQFAAVNLRLQRIERALNGALKHE